VRVQSNIVSIGAVYESVCFDSSFNRLVVCLNPASDESMIALDDMLQWLRSVHWSVACTLRSSERVRLTVLT
jgi:hypothetical protein